MNSKIYQHTFKNGDIVTLAVDLDASPIRMVASPFGIVSRHPEEYEQWTQTVVVPDLMNTVTPKQMMEIAFGQMKRRKSTPPNFRRMR